MDSKAINTKIKELLEAIPNWTGKIHLYIPPLSNEIDVANALMESLGDKIDVWFINRVRVKTLKYGEAPRGSIPTSFRQRLHLVQVRGFQSTRTTTESGDPSEVEFQALCDTIEEALTKNTSLGQTAPVVYFGGFEMDIGFDQIGKVLCHVMTARATVIEYIPTAYEI
jgi:hypothetical protein